MSKTVNVETLSDVELKDAYLQWSIDTHIAFGSSEVVIRSLRKKHSGTRVSGHLMLDGKTINLQRLKTYVQERVGEI